MKKQHIFVIFSLLLYCFPLVAQENYDKYFQEAYKLYPNIPEGMLEAVAYTNTRMHHVVPVVTPIGNCSGLPYYYGVMGLVEDGKGYFKNSLKMVAELSGYSVAEIKKSPRINILAYAKAYSLMQEKKDVGERGLEAQGNVLADLSELPADNSVHSQYVNDQNFYAVLRTMETNSRDLNAKGLDYEKIFGKERAKVLQAESVEVSERDITANGSSYIEDRSLGPSKTDYAGAIWSPASTANYSGRGGVPVQYITIHTIQGSYASAISWFRNPAAKVSAHYIIRAFDGQITQMVSEKDKAYHVRADNAGAVGLEHEGFVDDGDAWYTNEMYKASANLVRDICQRNNIDPLKMYTGKATAGANHQGNTCRKIKGHQHFPQNDHVDPGKYWDWDRFFRLVNGEIPDEKKVFTTTSGEVTDDGGKDNNYGNQKRIAYIIQSPGASAVTLDFTEFDLEGTQEKPYDYLDIFVGKNPDGQKIGRYSGAIPPKKIVVKGSFVYMEFISDCQETGKGFVLKYSGGQGGAPSGGGNVATPVENIMAANVNPFGATLKWEHAQGADKYLVYYKHALEEKWKLRATSNKELELSGLTSGKKYTWRVAALVGNDTSAVESNNFTLPGVSHTGNVETYNTTLTEGKMFDSGGSEGIYLSTEEYVYRIVPKNGEKVKFTLNYLETEKDNDYLYIYDGDTDGKLLAKLSGKYTEKQIFTSTSNALSIYFKSDSRTQMKGWSAEWASTGQKGSDAGVDINVPAPNTNTGGGSSSGGTAGGGTSGGSSGGNTTPPPVSVGAFEVPLSYGANSPISKAVLPATLTGKMNISFEDTDKSGKGIAQKFYLICEKSGKQWRANATNGFYFDNFHYLSAEWKTKGGTWEVKDGRYYQKDANASNTNAYAFVNQDNQTAFLYQWRARMTGASKSKRSGFHFFCENPEKENRGQSYFIWVRDTDGEDKIEVYRVNADDKFEKKTEVKIDFPENKAYDGKVFYNPSTGKIDVYFNEKLVVSWTDPSPLTTGKAISLRSGGAVTEFDEIRVYRTRSSSIDISVGAATNNDFRKESVGNDDAGRVFSMILDKNGKFSEETLEAAKVKFGATTPPPSGGGNTNTTPPTGGTTVPPKVPIPPKGGNTTPANGNVKTDDFMLDATVGTEIKHAFFNVSDFDGKTYHGNDKAGFAYEDFDLGTMYERWKITTGTWSQGEGKLSQSDDIVSNGNISIPVSQKNTGIYLYQFRAKVLSAGDNRRFGIHLFASEAAATNRGNSYFVWFRGNDSKEDKVEVYRTVGNDLKDGVSAPISIEKDKWYDIKIVLEPASGQITIWLDNAKVLTWKDTYPLLATGSQVSFRTGTAKVQFDSFRVYQARAGKQIISVGTKDTDMIRYQNAGTKPGGLILLQNRSKTDTWSTPAAQEVNVKFK